MSRPKFSVPVIVATVVVCLTTLLPGCQSRSGKITPKGRPGATDWCVETGRGECFPLYCKTYDRTVVFFHADWCPYCRRFSTEVIADPEVQEALKGQARIIVEYDKAGALVAKSRVDGIPATVFFGKDCVESERIPGFVDKKTFLEIIGELSK